jgi:hypothetical protein
MLFAVLLMLLISAGGAALTYRFTKDQPALWRFAAGTVFGSAIFGTAVFVAACVWELNIYVAVGCLLLTLVPVLFLRNEEDRKALRRDRARIKGNFQGASFKKILRFCYYLFFALLFLFFFERVIIESPQGIFTGGSNNLGDLPFHLGAIFSFTNADNFPPINPSFAGAKFSYPFVADLITAALMKFGIGLKDAMLATNVFWAFSLLVLTERFVLAVLGDKLAARLAPFLLFFSGGLGFIWFFGDYSQQAKGFFEFLNTLPADYTIGDNFRWGNSLITLFLTQRSLLLGMPITMAVMTLLWKLTERNEKAKITDAVLLGAVTGLLPLIHLHSLFVLFILCVFLLALWIEKWRLWLAFGVGVCITAVPELVWSVTGSASSAAKFFAVHLGWSAGDTNIFWFWLKNTGLVIPLLIGGVVLLMIRAKKKGENDEDEAGPERILLFYTPFVLVFILANIFKFAPWEWDNIKLLIYWYAASLPFICLILTAAWRKNTPLKVVAAVCFAVLIFSGVLDVWRTASGQINIRVFDADAVEFAHKADLRIPADAIILNAPTYNTAAALAGRISVMRYPGHLSSHGIDYAERERDVKEIYAGSERAAELIGKYGVRYIIVSPNERSSMVVDDRSLSRYPVVLSVGNYKLYEVR